MPIAAGRSALPYKILAGVEPCTDGWLVAPGNLQGIHLAPQTAFVLPTLTEVLDYRPSFTIIALHAPLGLMDEPGGARPCDVAARALLGPRQASLPPAPSRALLAARTFEEAGQVEPGLDAARWAWVKKVREATVEVQSWNQRTVWEVHPELIMRQMGGEPVPYGRRSEVGREYRAKLVSEKLPGAEQVLKDRPPGMREGKLIDALADLWAARRIAARAITRMSQDAFWDSEGLRMDIVC